MFDLKPLSPDAIPDALAKAERYRLLNEPRDAESICRDILRADPDHQEATAALLLSMTDQFGKGGRVSVNHARELLERLSDKYQRVYFGGVILERWAKSHIQEGTPGHIVYDWLRSAMEHYEQAQQLDPTSADPVLRYNACARIIKRHTELRPKKQDASIAAGYEDEVPGKG